MKNIIEKMKDSKKYRDILTCIGLFKEDFRHYGLHVIDYEDTPEKLGVTVYLEYPGMFIGRKGENINSIESKMRDKFEKSVRISIEEFQPIPLTTKERFYELDGSTFDY